MQKSRWHSMVKGKKDPLDGFTEKLQEIIRNDVRKKYSSKVIEEFESPNNVSRMKKPDSKAKITGPCGDTVEIFLKINNGAITKAEEAYKDGDLNLMTSMWNILLLKIHKDNLSRGVNKIPQVQDYYADAYQLIPPTIIKGEETDFFGTMAKSFENELKDIKTRLKELSSKKEK
jgi:hypothetical protein